MMAKIWEKAPSWQTYNRLGKSRVIRSSYFWIVFVPIAAKLLASVDPNVSIKIFDATFAIHFSLPFSWRIFYFSSLSFAAASFIYQAYCPAIIRDYTSYQTFLEEGKTEKQIRKYFIDVLFSKGVSYMSKFMEPTPKIKQAIHFIDEHLDTPKELIEKDPHDPIKILTILSCDKIHNSKIADSFWFVQSYSDLYNPFMRFMCALFYAFGLVLIGLVFMQNLLFVIKC